MNKVLNRKRGERSFKNKAEGSTSLYQHLPKKTRISTNKLHKAFRSHRALKLLLGITKIIDFDKRTTRRRVASLLKSISNHDDPRLLRITLHKNSISLFITMQRVREGESHYSKLSYPFFDGVDEDLAIC